jgi:hypothetical protein
MLGMSPVITLSPVVAMTPAITDVPSFCREWDQEDAAQHAYNLAQWRVKILQVIADGPSGGHH